MKQKNNIQSFWKNLFSRKSPEPVPPREENPPAPLPEPQPPEKSNSGTMLLIPDDESDILPQTANKMIRFSVSYNGMTRQMEIANFPCVLGRSPYDANMCLEDRSVSRKHAVIKCLEDAYIITDTDSSNGVIVNGVKIDAGASCQIHCGDTIKLGRIRLQVTATE